MMYPYTRWGRYALLTAILAVYAEVTMAQDTARIPDQRLLHTTDSLELELAETNDTGKKIALLDTLAELYDANSTSKTAEYRIQGYQLCAQQSDSACMAYQAFQSIYHLINLSTYNSALSYLKFTEGYYRTRDSSMYAQVLTRYGFYYDRLSDFQNALQYYLLAIRVFDAIGDNAGSADVYFRLGLIFYQLNNYPKALEFYESIIQRCETQQICFSYQNALFYSSRIYIEQGDYDRAKKYLKTYVELRKDASDIRPRAFVHWSQAMIDIAEGNQESTEAELEIALQLFQSIQLSGDVAIMYMTLGDLYRHQSVEKAIGMYEASLNSKPTMKVHQRLAECYKESGDSEKAFIHLHTYQELYEERNIGLEARIVEQELANAAKRYDQQLALLNSQTEVAKLSAARQRIQRNSLIVISVLLLSLAGLFYYQLRQNRKARSLLMEKNTIIDQSLHEKEDLLREIHHRVKNNLQIVSSMLHLQGRHIKDPAVLEALRDSRNRVNSMALIHQSLYKEEHLKGINVRDYLQSLTQSLITSYRVDPEKVRIKTDVQSLLLDVDSAIPIGLVTNELLTNAIKYAFVEREHGEIQVHLNQEDQILNLIVEDNGVGLPDDFKARTEESYGYHLVHSLARKLKAEVEIRNIRGCVVQLRIKQYKILNT